jgi:hypothetical protein
MIVNQPSGDVFLIASKLDNPRKQDLDCSARPIHASAVAQARVAVAMHEPTVALEADLLREMMVGGGVAIALFNAWRGNTSRAVERSFAGLNSAMATTPGFVRTATGFEARLRENLRAQQRTGVVDYHDLVTGPGPERPEFDESTTPEAGRATGRMLPRLMPPYVDLSLMHDRVAKICIGSIQGIRIWIKDFRACESPATYTATLRYELRDHFGVDDEDCEIAAAGLHGTPGQVAMWVLQHHRRPGHCPWITVVHVERTVRGSLS